MSMATYAERYAAAIAATLPADVTVGEGEAWVWVERMTHPVEGGAIISRASGLMFGEDRRKPVSPVDVQTTLAMMARRLGLHLNHYRDEHVRPARELVAILDTARESLGGE